MVSKYHDVIARLTKTRTSSPCPLQARCNKGFLQPADDLFPPQLEVHWQLPTALELHMHRVRTHSLDGMHGGCEELERADERLCRLVVLGLSR